METDLQPLITDFAGFKNYLLEAFNGAVVYTKTTKTIHHHHYHLLVRLKQINLTP